MTNEQEKTELLKKLVAAYSAAREFYYREDMLTETIPAWLYDLHGYIQKLRKEIAGA